MTDVVPACGVGHALVLNLSGNRDRCRNMSGGMLDYACPIGYCGVILAGQDVCRNTAADEYSPIGTRNIAGHRRGRAAPPGTW